MLFMILAACSSDDSNSSDDVFEGVENHKADVENYGLNIDMEVTISNEETKDVLQSSLASMDSDYFEESGNSAGSLRSVNDDIEENIDYYMIDDVAYANINGEGWEDATDSNIISDDNSTNYKAIAKLIAEIEDDVEVTSDDDHYLLSFEGINEDVYSAFETPYSLTLSGVTPADVEQDAKIKVNKETMYVESVQYTITGSNDGLKLELSIDHRYDNMNEIDDIEIPQDVIDEAN